MWAWESILEYPEAASKCIQVSFPFFQSIYHQFKLELIMAHLAPVTIFSSTNPSIDGFLDYLEGQGDSLTVIIVDCDITG